MMISITSVLASADIFCQLLPFTFVLLTFAAAYWYYRNPKVDDADVVPPTTPSAVPPIANNTSPPVSWQLLFRLLCIVPITSYANNPWGDPTWACVGFFWGSCMWTVEASSSTNYHHQCWCWLMQCLHDYEWWACHLWGDRGGFEVGKLSGCALDQKYRPSPMSVIIEAMVMGMALWTPLDSTPPPQQVQPTAVPVVSTSSKCSANHENYMWRLQWYVARQKWWRYKSWER